MLLKIVRRFQDLLTQRTYRRVLLARILDKMLRLYNPNIRYLGLQTADGITLLRTGETVVTPYALAENGFQAQDVRRALEIAAQAGCRMGGIFLDVGANIGTSTLYALRTGRVSRAYCFEPEPSNLRLLQMNVLLNDLGAQVTVLPQAVTDKPTRISMRISAENPGDHRVVSSAISEANNGCDLMQVEATSLDAFLQHSQLTPGDVSFLWIDTQGHEGSVLAGAQVLMEHGVPMCVEFWPEGLAAAGGLETFCELLTRHYRKFYDLRQAQAEALDIQEIWNYRRRIRANDYCDLVVLR